MKLISWNVNGIRAALQKGFLNFVAAEKPDILCLQETKAHPSLVDLKLPEYHPYWNSAVRPGYSGTAILTKIKPLNVVSGMDIADCDDEGRMLTAEFERFFLVNVYTPNSKRDLSRLSYRCERWDVVFLNYVKQLEKTKPVVFCGDLNVAHKEIDLTYPESNRKNHGFTDEERAGFDNIVKHGFVDTFRALHPEGGHYTWWSPFRGCRARNIGWRIDYFCVSASIRAAVKKSYMLPHVLGSDHCPIVIEADF